VKVRITHVHNVRGVPNPLELSLETSSLPTHSYFGDRPEHFDRLVFAVRTSLEGLLGPSLPKGSSDAQ